jgi:hypothetical protein
VFGGVVAGVVDGAAVAITLAVVVDGELTDAAGSVEAPPTVEELWVIVMLGAASFGEAVGVEGVDGVDVDGEVTDGDPTPGAPPDPPVLVLPEGLEP